MLLAALLLWAAGLALWHALRGADDPTLRKRAAGRTWLLVIAHPDDEAMFFSAALQALHAAGARVAILCLSSGTSQCPSNEARGRDVTAVRQATPMTLATFASTSCAVPRPISTSRPTESRS